MAVDAALADPARARVLTRQHVKQSSLGRRILDWLPQGNLLDDEVWRKRHHLLQWFLVLHLPVLILFGLYMKHSPEMVLITVSPIAVTRVLGGLPAGRRVQSFFTTAGIVYGAVALVVFANGAIEAHFDFFIVIGFIALYQDWVPFGWDVAFTVLSHGIGSAFKPDLIFNTMAGMDHPWRMSFIHGFAVLLACVGVVLFWRTNEDEQQKTLALTVELGDAEMARRKFTSDLLVNLARRNQSMLYRQLDIINQLEEKEQDPDALFELFRLDHLATRIRRNAENLLVLSGEEAPRVWGKPVPLTDVVRAAIAETEDLSRVTFSVDERLTLVGQAVIDVTHLLAELIENAVRSSPPESRVTVRTAPDVRAPGSVTLTVEDWGVGMPPEDLVEANEVLSHPRDVDALVSNRLGLHVISRLAHRYGIQVVLTATSGSGITAVLLLPPDLFTASAAPSSGSLPMQPAPVVRAGRDELHPGAQRRPRPAVTAAAIDAPPAPLPARPVPAAVPVPPPPPPARTPPPSLQPIQVDRLSSAPRWDGWWEAEPDGGFTHEMVDGGFDPNGYDTSGFTETVHRTGSQTIGSPPTPAQRPGGHPTGAPATGPAPIDTPQVVLTRRIPQAHLAPELQRDRDGTIPTRVAATAPTQVPAAPPDAARAREALSRYQASRQAALAEQGAAERNRS